MKVSEGAPQEQPPVGTSVARCCRIIDVGTQATTFNGQVKHMRKVLISWELEDQMEGIYKPENKGKPFVVTKSYTASLAPNARMKKDLQSWRGKMFTKEELQGFELKNVLGHCCTITLIESDTGYVNVDALGPIKKGQAVPKPVNTPVFFSLEKEEYDAKVLATFSGKLQEKIKSSPEYRALAVQDAEGSDDMPPGTEGDEHWPQDDVPF